MGRRTVVTPEKKGIDILNDAVEMAPLSALKLHPRNVNRGDVGAIHESIAHNGFWGTIVAQRSTGFVLAGNHRLIAAQQGRSRRAPRSVGGRRR